ASRGRGGVVEGPAEGRPDRIVAPIYQGGPRGGRAGPGTLVPAEGIVAVSYRSPGSATGAALRAGVSRKGPIARPPPHHAPPRSAHPHRPRSHPGGPGGRGADGAAGCGPRDNARVGDTGGGAPVSAARCSGAAPAPFAPAGARAQGRGT